MNNDKTKLRSTHEYGQTGQQGESATFAGEIGSNISDRTNIHAQSFSHEIQIPSSEHNIYEWMINLLGDCIGFFGSIPCCLCFPNPYQTVEQGQVGLISRFGKYYKTVDPGLYFVNMATESIKTKQVSIQIQSIPQQVVMTKDNVNVIIDSVLYWHVIDPYTAVFIVSDVERALIERTQTTLRQVFGSRTLQDAIESRESIAHQIEEIVKDPARSWGVKIESILIKDLKFTEELQQNLSAAAKAKRIGESKVIAAQAEVEAARLMREASDILNTPAAMQIRYLDTLSTMSKSSGTKVIFMPLNSSDGHDGMKQIKDKAVLEMIADHSI